MIQNDKPLTQEAVQEKVYDQLWIYNLRIHSPSTTNGMISIELLPMTSGGELASGKHMIHLSTENMAEINAIPQVSAAFSAILAAIGPLKAHLEAQQ